MGKSIQVGPDNGRVAMIDYLKGFSIFTIVLMHLMMTMSAMPSAINKLASIGGTGVHVFFLCSGIGLYMSFLRRRVGFIDFLKRRMSKIYVPYIIVVFISFLLPWMFDGNRIIALLSHVFLFKMFSPVYEQSFGSHFWFISTIIQLYLLFIPMCLLKDKLKNNKIFFFIFFGMSVVWWMIVFGIGQSEERVWNSFCFQYIWEFALGFIIGEAFYKGKGFNFSHWQLLVAAILGIGIQAGMALGSDALRVFNDVPAVIGYTALALLLSNLGIVKWAGNQLSKFSYEFFLVHILIFETIFYFINPQGLLVQSVVALAALVVALFAGWLYSQLVTKTINRSQAGVTIVLTLT